MKITEIGPCSTWAGRRNWVFVKVVTDRGIHGWGEATLEGREQTVEAAITELGRLLIGEDPLAVERDWQILHRRFWRGGVVLQTAIGGLDQALWDIRGKAWGVPVYRLLGGPTRDRLRLYMHAGLYDPAAAESEAEHARLSGFTAVKTGAWVGDSVLPERERVSVAVDRYKRLREHVGPEIDVLVDNHGRSRSAEAALLGKELVDRGAFWLEEPTAPEDVDGLARVRAACPALVLAAGERCYSKRDALPLLERRLVDVIQPDLCHAGESRSARRSRRSPRRTGSTLLRTTPGALSRRQPLLIWPLPFRTSRSWSTSWTWTTPHWPSPDGSSAQGTWRSRKYPGLGWSSTRLDWR
jgi:galactonate dehydratase